MLSRYVYQREYYCRQGLQMKIGLWRLAILVLSRILKLSSTEPTSSIAFSRKIFICTHSDVLNCKQKNASSNEKVSEEANQNSVEEKYSVLLTNEHYWLKVFAVINLKTAIATMTSRRLCRHVMQFSNKTRCLSYVVKAHENDVHKLKIQN